MRFTVITPNYNGARFLEQTLRSVIGQRGETVELEYIVVDGNSTDGSHEIIEKYTDDISHIIIEQDSGPASAINKGFALATGDVVSWLNADDIYFPGTLERVGRVLDRNPDAALCFGRCPIVDDQGREIRRGITSFKEFFYPFSSRFVFQSINYLSQPALFFNRHAFDQAGLLREDMVAAWDYDFILRIWRAGRSVQVTGEPLAAFRWHEQSISGRHFKVQFQEEYEAACKDAGRFSLQAFCHFFVRWGIVGMYSLMASSRQRP
jgi:glycosyltransferase involved in cell wall biosynthesis